ncbi:hypothetical protein [Sorangium sp. So ce1151]|uniref:hypothetical protein n=1 Tax=Sorangium sp. So ce1151 TaxID=3133332 RepID=UPI003F63F7F2
MEGEAISAIQQSAALPIALVWRHAGKAETRLLSLDTPLVVGRAAPAALCIDDRTLSREHARLLQRRHAGHVGEQIDRRAEAARLAGESDQEGLTALTAMEP